jgi:tripartite-type tricarboxylate transporter receptor subunit TctC
MKKGVKKQIIIRSRKGEMPLSGRNLPGRVLLLSLLILGVLGFYQGVQAQDFPQRPISLIINMPVGGGSDACARMIADAASKILGQDVTPVNRTGGGGSVGVGILASAKGDGYTLMSGPSSAITNSPHIESVPYDPLKDIVPIIQFGEARAAIVVRSDSPFNSLKDLIDFARKNPGKVTSGHNGVGSSLHLITEYLNLEEKVNIITVPFAGSTPAVTALLGGHISACALGNTFLPYYKSGKVKVLAAYAEKRIEDVPNAPTLRELGYRGYPGEEVMAIIAPKGTPGAIIDKLEATFRKIIKSQEYRNLAEKTYQMYMEEPLSTHNLKEVLDRDYLKNGEIIRKIKLGK